MSSVDWDLPNKRYAEYGVEGGVLYALDGDGEFWNGLRSVSETSSSTSVSSYFIDGEKVFQSHDNVDFALKVSAFTFPDMLADGRYGFSWRTRKSNSEYDHYKLHILYNAVFVADESTYSTITNTIEPIEFSWSVHPSPLKTDGFASVSHIIIDSEIAYSWLLEDLEHILYGNELDPPRLPSLSEILDIFERNSILIITDHGDGTWTAEGPDEIVRMIGPTEFEIRWPSVIFLDSDTYQVSSL